MDKGRNQQTDHEEIESLPKISLKEYQMNNK